MQSINIVVINIICACSGPLVTTRTMRPVADNQEAAPRTSLLHHHHQCTCDTFNATTPDSTSHTQSPKPVCNTEDVTKTLPTGPTEETALNTLSTSELVIIFHQPLPVVLKRPLHYPRDGTSLMSQSCINFACYAPAAEAITTGHDDSESLLCLTIVPEQETFRSNENTELVF